MGNVSHLTPKHVSQLVIVQQSRLLFLNFHSDVNGLVTNFFGQWRRHHAAQNQKMSQNLMTCQLPDSEERVFSQKAVLNPAISKRFNFLQLSSVRSTNYMGLAAPIDLIPCIRDLLDRGTILILPALQQLWLAYKAHKHALTTFYLAYFMCGPILQSASSDRPFVM